jgi:hypothetical protein
LRFPGVANNLASQLQSARNVARAAVASLAIDGLFRLVVLPRQLRCLPTILHDHAYRQKVHISAVERAGLNSLNDGQTVECEIESNRGKESAVNVEVK